MGVTYYNCAKCKEVNSEYNVYFCMECEKVFCETCSKSCFVKICSNCNQPIDYSYSIENKCECTEEEKQMLPLFYYRKTHCDVCREERVDPKKLEAGFLSMADAEQCYLDSYKNTNNREN